MSILPDIECTNSPKYVGLRETELPFEFDWTDQGTPTAVTSVVMYNAAGSAVATCVTGTPSISGNKVQGITIDCSKLTANTEFYLVCLATLGGRVRGLFCRIIANAFP